MADQNDIYTATTSFTADGIQVNVGDTVVAGHPILKGRRDFFRPFEPTFIIVKRAAAKPFVPAGDQPSGLEAYAALEARAKELGLPAKGKAEDLEAAIAEAEAKQATATSTAEDS